MMLQNSSVFNELPDPEFVFHLQDFDGCFTLCGLHNRTRKIKPVLGFVDTKMWYRYGDQKFYFYTHCKTK